MTLTRLKRIQNKGMTEINQQLDVHLHTHSQKDMTPARNCGITRRHSQLSHATTEMGADDGRESSDG